MLNELKNFDIQRASIEELVEKAAQARVIRSEFENREIESPEWLTVLYASLGNEIKAKNRDRLEAKLRDLQARQESLKTTAEKRTENAKEIARLKKSLGQVA